MSNHILDNLNKQQQEAVAQTEGPILIIAGPGSGKTRVLTHKVAYLIEEKKVEPHRILCVTFTNKAAKEMRERINSLLGNAIHVPWISTFHAFGARILRREGHHIGLSPSFAIYDTTDAIALINQLLKEQNLPTDRLKAGSILGTIESAKNELIPPEEYHQYAHGYFQNIVAELYPKYQKRLVKNNAVDFGDLLMKTIQLFRQNTDVLQQYTQNFTYILIDEYQDTNFAQYTLIKLLTSHNQNICVVGDINQAIYSWRGADLRNLMQFEKDYPNAKIFRLEQNYRSTKSIIKAADEIIKKSRHHLHLDLWTGNEEGDSIALYEAQNEEEEAKYIVSQIVARMPENNLSQEEENSLGHFAVLYRTNAQSRAIEDIFVRWGIPYRLVGGVKFYERKEVKDVLAYLRLMRNPEDSVAIERVQKLGKRRYEKFLEFQQVTDSETFSVLELLDQLLQKTAYLELYSRDNEENRERKENVKELRSVATQFGNLDEFLENVSLVQEDYSPRSQLAKGDKPTITLMTLHSAKGLEFNTVFIVGMEEGLFPHSRALSSPEELEEERRLCYVGFTRAKEKLHLTYARNRLYFGARQYGTVSRFIEDIPSDLLEARFGVRL